MFLKVEWKSTRAHEHAPKSVFHIPQGFRKLHLYRRATKSASPLERAPGATLPELQHRWRFTDSTSLHVACARLPARGDRTSGVVHVSPRPGIPGQLPRTAIFKRLLYHPPIIRGPPQQSKARAKDIHLLPTRESSRAKDREQRQPFCPPESTGAEDNQESKQSKGQPFFAHEGERASSRKVDSRARTSISWLVRARDIHLVRCGKRWEGKDIYLFPRCSTGLDKDVHPLEKYDATELGEWPIEGYDNSSCNPD